MNSTFTAKVIKGESIGRILGFPTANLSVDDSLSLKDGVYAVRVELDNQIYYGVANLGDKPTIEGKYPRALEVNIFDFGENIYGKTLRVDFIQYIREQKKFSSLDELKQNIAKDIQKTKEIIRCL